MGPTVRTHKGETLSKEVKRDFPTLNTLTFSPKYLCQNLHSTLSPQGSTHLGASFQFTWWKGGWTRLLQILNPYAVATPAPAPAWPSGCLAHLPEELMGNLLS